MTINVALLRKTLEHITAHPKEWDQGAWAVRASSGRRSCGTAYCLAGTALVLDGHRIKWEAGQRESAYLTDGRYIADAARELLGLDEHEAAELFSGDNSLRHLWECASHLTDGEIEIPADLSDRAAMIDVAKWLGF